MVLTGIYVWSSVSPKAFNLLMGTLLCFVCKMSIFMWKKSWVSLSFIQAHDISGLFWCPEIACPFCLFGRHSPFPFSPLHSSPVLPCKQMERYSKNAAAYQLLLLHAGLSSRKLVRIYFCSCCVTLWKTVSSSCVGNMAMSGYGARIAGNKSGSVQVCFFLFADNDYFLLNSR